MIKSKIVNKLRKIKKYNKKNNNKSHYLSLNHFQKITYQAVQTQIYLKLHNKSLIKNLKKIIKLVMKFLRSFGIK